jgi:membrane-bound ClpP family serine protease
MEEILNKKIYIKDYTLGHIIISIIILCIIAYFVPLKSNSDVTILIGVEQAFFVILSAILFVFHDSIIGFKSISKLRNEINKLSTEEIKFKILQYIDTPEQSANYNEFLTTIDKQMISFTKESDKFKQKSYKLYVIFSILGLIAITLSLIGSYLIVDKYIMDMCIYTQILLVLLWVISAFQAEKQKIQMFSFISIKNIKTNIKNYIDSKNQEEIEIDLDR